MKLGLLRAVLFSDQVGVWRCLLPGQSLPAGSRLYFEAEDGSKVVYVDTMKMGRRERERKRERERERERERDALLIHRFFAIYNMYVYIVGPLMTLTNPGVLVPTRSGVHLSLT